jgi:type IV pilus assembly protein PilW
MTVVPMNCPPSHLRARQGVCAARSRGFTLVEILVALALGVLILLALTVLFSRNTGNQSELERTVRQVESARFALDTLSEDVMHAGYFGEFDPDTLVKIPGAYDVPINYQTPDPCATDPASQGWKTHGLPAPPNDRIQIPVPAQGIAAATAVACLANRRAGTEAVVVRRADTGPPTTLAASKADNLYIQISRCATIVEPGIRADAGTSASFTLRLPDCATANPSLRRLSQRTYFVADCNDCAANDGIPTLKRVEMVDGALRTLSIAEGVENLQLEYGLDTNDDGQPDNFVTAGSGVINGVAPNQWQNVVAVRLHVLARSSQPTSGYSDVRTYQVGPAVTVTAPSDGFKRTLVTSSVRLNNVGGRRE